jgi:hypothetical protein
MNENLRTQIDGYLRQLNTLIERGRQLRDALASDPSNTSTIAANRVWQQDCGVTINQLSGGSKSHWLARSFSEAFLMRAPSGGVIETAAPHEIADRLVAVLERATTSLSQMDDVAIASESSRPAAPAGAPPAIRKFGFVHNAELRAVVEQAYSDSQRALEEGRYSESLFTSCGVLEAIVTDALEHNGFGSVAQTDLPASKIADWPFETRLAVAARAGLIHNGWTRLPQIARRYRDLADPDSEHNPKETVSERDARQAGQVLHVVMRDLNPGR